MIEIEKELQAYIDECTRLKHHLEELLKEKEYLLNNNPNYSANNLQKIQNSNLTNESLENSASLSLLTEENNKLKQRIQEIERRRKKNKLKNIELQALKSEVQIMKNEIERITKENEIKETIYKDEIKNLNTSLFSYDNNSKLSGNLIKENLIKIDKLENELKFLKLESLNQSKKELKKLFKKKKQKNPPQLLSIIHSILKSKKIIVGVLFSFIDKNNIGIIEIEEFMKKINEYSNKIKRHHITSLFESIEYKENFISLYKLEKLYEQYDYNDENSSYQKDQKSESINESELKFFRDQFSNISDTNEYHKISRFEESKEVNERQSDKNIIDIEKIKNKLNEHSNQDPNLDINIENEQQADLKNKQMVICSNKRLLETRCEESFINYDANHHNIEENKLETIAKEKIKSLLRHVFFRLQINRVPRENIKSTLFGSISGDQLISKTLIVSILKSPPLNIYEASDQEMLVNYLGENNSLYTVCQKLVNDLDY